MKRTEHIYVRLSNIERYLAELARFHADAGRPAHVAGVRSALAKIRREVARSENPSGKKLDKPMQTGESVRCMHGQ